MKLLHIPANMYGSRSYYKAMRKNSDMSFYIWLESSVLIIIFMWVYFNFLIRVPFLLQERNDILGEEGVFRLVLHG
jgi:hypothetical protein